MILNVAHVFYTVLLSFFHPFFLSMTDVNYNDKAKELEISVRIFTDDFENTLKKNYNEKVDVLHPADTKEMNRIVNDYLQKNLQFRVDNSTVQLHFIGYEQQEESIWSYFEVTNVSGVKKLEITNSLLHDYTANQVNMIHVKVGDMEKSTKLDFPAKQALFGF